MPRSLHGGHFRKDLLPDMLEVWRTSTSDTVKCEKCSTMIHFWLQHYANCLLAYLLINALSNTTLKSSISPGTHTRPFNGPFSRTTWVSRYQKGKTSLDFTEASDSGMYALCSRQTTTPASHHTQFFTGGMPFLPPNQQLQSTEGISPGSGQQYRLCWAGWCRDGRQLVPTSVPECRNSQQRRSAEPA